MKLYWWKSFDGNFGDDLNPWLYGKHLQLNFDLDETQIVLGIGSILHFKFEKKVKEIIVLGSGLGREENKKWPDKRYKFIFVRGPITARRLGISEKLSITDPGYLIKNFVRVGETKEFSCTFIPHMHNARVGNWQRVCNLAQINYLDPRTDVDTFIDVVSKSKLVLAEAMHGAIAADALGVPWIPVASDVLSPSCPKWEDWLLTVGGEYRPVKIPFLYSLENPLGKRIKYSLQRALLHCGCGQASWNNRKVLVDDIHFEEKCAGSLIKASKAPQNLTDEKVVDLRVCQLLEEIEKFRQDYAL